MHCKVLQGKLRYNLKVSITGLFYSYGGSRPIFYGNLFLQAKADEIAKLMHENEQLKSATEDLKVLESTLKVHI